MKPNWDWNPLKRTLSLWAALLAGFLIAAPPSLARQFDAHPIDVPAPLMPPAASFPAPVQPMILPPGPAAPPSYAQAAIAQYLEVEEAERFYVGASAMFLVPRYESNLAFTAISISPPIPGIAPIPSISRRFTEFSYKLTASPRVWLGMELTDNVGARVTWWSYDQTATPKTVLNPPIPLGSPVAVNMIQSASPLMAISSTTLLPGVNSIQTQGVPSRPDALLLTNSLSFNVWDFDATYSGLEVGPATLTLFGGMRYAYVTQTFDSYARGNIPQTLLSKQSFNGFGPSGGIQVHMPLSSLPGLALYGNGRIGFLFGEDLHSSAGQTLGHIPPYNLTTNSDESGRQRFLPTFDIEFGLEWSHTLDSGSRLFTRAGVMAQGWPLGSGSSGNGNLGLLGFTLSTGFNY